MKYILLIAICLILTNCGPSAEQKAFEQKTFEAHKEESDSLKRADAAPPNPAPAKEIKLTTNAPVERKFVKTADLKFKVSNTQFATEKIEDLAIKYGGYITYSNLQNKEDNFRTSTLSKDSLLVAKQIVVTNDISLRIPNNRLDSFVRELNPLVLFFDYRVIRLSDVTLQALASQKKTERLQKYEQRQMQHIDKKNSKLTETNTAEDNLLEHQNQSDALQLKTQEIDDQIKYCNLTIEIYQKPVIIKEVVANFDAVTEVKIKFFNRLWDALVTGWSVLEELILFLSKLWGVVLIGLVIFFGAKYLLKLYRKSK